MRQTILIIDDDDKMLSMLGRNLTAKGYTAFCSKQPPTIEEFSKIGADLVVVDWMLDGASGLDWVAQLRTDARYASLPVLMMSGRCSDGERVRALEGGPDDFISKPFPIAELTARVRNLLRRAGSPPLRYDDGYLCIDVARRAVSAGGEPQGLTRSEWALLSTLLACTNQPVRRERLSESIWGETHQGGKRLEMLAKRLRQRLGRSAYIDTVRGVGYQFIPQATTLPSTT